MCVFIVNRINQNNCFQMICEDTLYVPVNFGKDVIFGWFLAWEFVVQYVLSVLSESRAPHWEL